MTVHHWRAAMLALAVSTHAPAAWGAALVREWVTLSLDYGDEATMIEGLKAAAAGREPNLPDFHLDFLTGRADLNDDGREELFVYCSTIFCEILPMEIMVAGDHGWETISRLFDASTIAVLEDSHDGFHAIFTGDAVYVWKVHEKSSEYSFINLSWAFIRDLLDYMDDVPIVELVPGGAGPLPPGVATLIRELAGGVLATADADGLPATRWDLDGDGIDELFVMLNDDRLLTATGHPVHILQAGPGSWRSIGIMHLDWDYHALTPRPNTIRIMEEESIAGHATLLGPDGKALWLLDESGERRYVEFCFRSRPPDHCVGVREP